jgi:hypothetical protein
MDNLHEFVFGEWLDEDAEDETQYTQLKEI